MSDAKFTIERSYPERVTNPVALNFSEIDHRHLLLRIITNKKLPSEFFDDLQAILTKHTL